MTLVLPTCLEWLAPVAGTVLRRPILNWRMGLCLSEILASVGNRLISGVIPTGSELTAGVK
jgi:hypothetical protein